MSENLSLSKTSLSVEDIKKDVLEFCLQPRRKEEILHYIKLEPRPYNYKKYIARLFQDRYLQHTIPQNPRSGLQQYIITKKGLLYLKSIS